MDKLPSNCNLLLLVLGVLLLSSEATRAELGVMDRIMTTTEKPYDARNMETVYPLPVKTVTAQETYQGGAFKVLARKDHLNRYPCSGCHGGKNPLVTDGALFTHSDVVINHGTGDNALHCSDCHDEKERNFLVDKQGKKIDLDHSYQLCGECHFRPKRDWLGGAHGKRETYWAGERVVRNCTSCHNPHSPAFPTKMPETYSLPLSE